MEKSYYWIELLAGASLGGGVVLLFNAVPDLQRILLWFSLPVILSSLFLGMGIASGRARSTAIELCGAIFTWALALVGIWIDPLWITAALFFQGAWSLFHIPTARRIPIPLWFSPFSLAFAWICAGWLALSIH